MKSTIQTTIRNIPSFIRIIAIKDSFKESRPKNYKTITSDILYDSSLKSLNLKTTVYEVLKHSDVIKFFMDIEGIPETEEGLIFIIIDSFKKYMTSKHNINFSGYTITINKNSQNHSGLSYHVIYDGVYSNIYNIGKFITDFANTEGKFVSNFIDTSVYSKVRLFKLPLQIGTNNDNATHKRSRKSTNYHQILLRENDNKITFNGDVIKTDVVQDFYQNYQLMKLKSSQINTKEYIMSAVIQLVPRNAKQCECNLNIKINFESVQRSGKLQTQHEEMKEMKEEKPNHNVSPIMNIQNNLEELIKVKVYALKEFANGDQLVEKIIEKYNAYVKEHSTAEGFEGFTLSALNTLFDIYLKRLNINI